MVHPPRSVRPTHELVCEVNTVAVASMIGVELVAVVSTVGPAREQRCRAVSSTLASPPYSSATSKSRPERSTTAMGSGQWAVGSEQ